MILSRNDVFFALAQSLKEWRNSEENSVRVLGCLFFLDEMLICCSSD